MKKILATLVVVAVMFSCKLSVNAADLNDIFSAQYYADTYEDLYAAFEYDEAKLLKHVREYGLKEKRDISPILDVVYYRETYPDLNAAFGDNWDAYVNHYFEYGIKEGRDNGTSFDIIRYVNSYADLREAFDEDYEALAKHYIEYGMKENRTMALKPQVASVPSVSAPSVPAPLEPTYVHEYNPDGTIAKSYVYAPGENGELLGTIEYTYNGDGLVERSDMYYADGTFMGALAYTYNPDGSYIEENYDETNTLTYTTTYDANDKPLRVEFADGSVSEYTYNGDVLSGKTVIRADGSYNIYEYNANQTVKRDTEYEADGSLIVIKDYTYTGNNEIPTTAKDTYPDNSYAITEYDTVTGRETKRTEYDSSDNITSITESTYEGNIEVLRKCTFSDGSYELNIMDEDGMVEYKKYRADGTLEMREIFNDDGTSTIENYDSNGNLIVDEEPPTEEPPTEEP